MGIIPRGRTNVRAQHAPASSPIRKGKEGGGEKQQGQRRSRVREYVHSAADKGKTAIPSEWADISRYCSQFPRLRSVRADGPNHGPEHDE